jgi:hypothetical protein
MKRVAVLLGVVGIVLLTAQAAIADKGGTPNRDPVPACANSQGSAPQKNPHCYPPQGQSAQAQTAGKKASFQFQRDAETGITVGVLLLAGLGAFTLFFGTRAIARRRLIS